MNKTEYKLTQYSHGAGCGCKISPKILRSILHPEPSLDSNSQSEPVLKEQNSDSNKLLSSNKSPNIMNLSSPGSRLLIGNETSDDAAVMDLGDGRCIISTTDFFMPIVDDAFDFGRIASANAISDVYAMGGRPLMAIAILGWPIDKLPPEIASKVLDGSRSICSEAGIVLAGGHSIDCPEPIFGLAVTGEVELKNIKQNSTAKSGDLLYLTKPLGVGILTTAQKKGILQNEDRMIAPKQMMELNSIGYELGKLEYIHALTDVTGFGLLGHLTEICEGSNLSATIFSSKVPIITQARYYLERNSIPGGTLRNWDSYGEKIGKMSEEEKNIFCDPQTSGGLLIAVDPNKQIEFEKFMKSKRKELHSFGYLGLRKDPLISFE